MTEPHWERACPCAQWGGCADEGGCAGCCGSNWLGDLADDMNLQDNLDQSRCAVCGVRFIQGTHYCFQVSAGSGNTPGGVQGEAS